eukprot:5124935-Prymnesium_polylepis.1
MHTHPRKCFYEWYFVWECQDCCTSTRPTCPGEVSTALGVRAPGGAQNDARSHGTHQVRGGDRLRRCGRTIRTLHPSAPREVEPAAALMHIRCTTLARTAQT